MMKDMRLKNAVDGFLITRAVDGLSEHSLLLSKWALSRLVDYTGNPMLSEIDLSVMRSYMNFMMREYKPTRPGGNTSPLAGSNLD